MITVARQIWVVVYFDWFIRIFHHHLKSLARIINIRLFIPKIVDYSKILTDEEVKDFVGVKFGLHFQYTREKLHFKLGEEKNR